MATLIFLSDLVFLVGDLIASFMNEKLSRVGRRKRRRKRRRRRRREGETHLEERADFTNVCLILSVIIFHFLHCHIWTPGDHRYTNTRTCKRTCIYK